MPRRTSGRIVVNMVAMPSDLVLDEPFIGKLGSQQYNQRANINPVAPGTKIDADGVPAMARQPFPAGGDIAHKHVLRRLPVIRRSETLVKSEAANCS
mgnify:CR=1 FL=1